jgi:endogenous inhibitor of DNA gyrase (YacG/DUF329 family)
MKRPPPTCNTCGGELPGGADPKKNKWFPFCSERCQAVDLGRWFRGDFVITTPLQSLPEDPLDYGDEDEWN